jgi:hypothetical protein
MTPDQLQQRLEQFGAGLTAQQLEEFRKILWEIGVLHNSIGDIYKYAELALIPRDKPIAADIRNSITSHQLGIGNVPTSNSFTPEKKKTGNPLEELIHNINKLSTSQLNSIKDQLKEKVSQSENSETLVSDTKQST